jgi:hypothetical protein
MHSCVKSDGTYARARKNLVEAGSERRIIETVCGTFDQCFFAVVGIERFGTTCSSQ